MDADCVIRTTEAGMKTKTLRESDDLNVTDGIGH